MIAEIENAILEIIRGAFKNKAMGYAVSYIESYGGELDDLDELAQVMRTFPAIWVTYAGSGKPTPVGTSKTKWLVPATFAVMCGSRNVRGERFTRQGLKVNGEVKEVGVYQMLADMRQLLLRQDFGMAIDPLGPGLEKTLFNTRLNGAGLAIFAQEWHTKFVITAPAALPDPNAPDWDTTALSFFVNHATAPAATDVISQRT